MKFSILDQVPISSGKTAQDALQSSIRLAQLGDRLGYERFWIAEHHDLFGLACSNPSVMIGVIASQTHTIKVGAGAVLLPYYKPFHIAETYHLLATLFPGRIDLGLGRAPGGSAEVSQALSDNYLAEVKKFPNKIDELNQFILGQFPDGHLFEHISATPVPEIPPDIWLLGTSDKSALLAAEKEMNYAFGHFMTDDDGPAIVRKYRENTKNPYVIVAVTVICAETTVKAHELAQSSLLWKLRQSKQDSLDTVPSIEEAQSYVITTEDEQIIKEMKKNMIIGNPIEVKEKLDDLQEQYEADEWMVVTIVHSEQAKFKSYELLLEQFEL